MPTEWLLAELRYNLNQRFYKMEFDPWCDALTELNEMIHAAGLTLNQVAQVLAGKEC
jgi:hypothetical protein